MKDSQFAYALFRIAFGVNFATRGLTRVLGGIPAFAEHAAHDFAHAPVPHVVVMGFLYTLPLLEVALGAAILLGAFLKAALITGSALMVVLTFGSCLTGKYDIVGVQLLYSLVFYVLLVRRADDAFSVDRARHVHNGDH